MHLFARWCRQERGLAPSVLVVDHSLRDNSSKEAALVCEWAAELGLAAHVLRWEHSLLDSGLEEKARAARYRLIGDWCMARGVPSIFVAHTREDQAETFLLRLGRGSGVDGLSAMAPSSPFPVLGFDSLRLFRPLLDVSRTELRAYLSARNLPWLEDPMNQDVRFARVRVRKVLSLLEASGVAVERIAEAAAHLQRARRALDEARDNFLAAHAKHYGKRVLVDAAALSTLSREIALRVLSKVLMQLGEVSYRPRFERLERLLDAILSGDFAARTLCGCRVGKAPKAHAVFGADTLIFLRENPRKTRQETEKSAKKRIIVPAEDTGGAELRDEGK